MPTETKLKGISDITESTLCDQLESNLIAFFDWGLLGVGAFFNVTKEYEESRLRLSEDPRYSKGKVWEMARKAVVWENNIEYDLQPIGISGVYVNNVFYPSNTVGAYAHNIDYANGRVVFNNTITATDVRLEYSYKYFNFTNSDVNWFREVMFESFKIDEQFTQYGSGVWSVFGQNRVQLPAVVVEAVPRRTFKGYQLGGGQIVNQDVLFHIFTENPWDRKTMLDIITYQNDKTISTFDKNLVTDANKLTFDDDGYLAPGALTYPQLIAPTGDGGFFWKKITFSSVSGQETISMPPLYQALVRGTFEVILPI